MNRNFDDFEFHEINSPMCSCIWHVFGFLGISSAKTEPRRFKVYFFFMSSRAWFLEIPLRSRQHKSCKYCYVLIICFGNVCCKIPKYLWELFSCWSFAKLVLVYLMCKFKLLLSSFFECYSSVMPPEEFTVKFKEGRLKEWNKSLINIRDIGLTWLRRISLQERISTRRLSYVWFFFCILPLKSSKGPRCKWFIAIDRWRINENL